MSVGHVDAPKEGGVSVSDGSRPDRGDIGKEMVHGVGDGDAETVGGGICSIVGVLCLVLDVSPAFGRVSERIRVSAGRWDAKWFRFGIPTYRSRSPENGGYQ